MVNEKENTGIMNVFNPDELETCSVSSDTTTGGIRTSLGGIQRVMKPGDKLTLSHTIIPIDDVRDLIKSGK